MSHTIKELHNLSDEELISEHDRKAVNTVVGTSYYMEELDRRSREKSNKIIQQLSVDTQKLAARSYRLSLITLITSIIALVIGVVSIFK